MKLTEKTIAVTPYCGCGSCDYDPHWLIWIYTNRKQLDIPLRVN